MSAAVDNPVRIGERFERRVVFDAASIRQFAMMSGDHNPLHHDDAVAEASPFGGIIVSGPHVTSLLLGLDATYFTQWFDALGLSFEFRFLKAIPADTALTLEWTIAACTHKPSLDGYIVDVEGRAVDDAGTVYTTAHGANLIRIRQNS
jgi:acyl dehydratase